MRPVLTHPRHYREVAAYEWSFVRHGWGEKWTSEHWCFLCSAIVAFLTRGRYHVTHLRRDI